MANSAHGLPSIRRRLLLTQALVSALFSALTAVMVWIVTGHEMEELMDLELKRSAEVIRRVVAEVPLDAWAGFGLATSAVSTSELAWQLVNPGADAPPLARSPQAPAEALTRQPSAEPVESADGHWRYIAVALQETQSDPAPLLVVAHSTSERNEGQRKAVGLTVLIAMGLGLLAAMLLAWRIRRELQPLERLSDRLRHFDPLAPPPASDLAQRRELQPIQDALGELGQRLAQRLRRERAFSAHAAHALRTPVAGLDAQLAIALKEAPETLRPRLARARDATGRLSRVMQALLALFRSGMEPQRQTVRLSDCVGPLAPAGLALQCEGEPTISADPDLLTAALLNLIDNAQKHGASHLTFTAQRDATHHTLTLQDDGQGCPPERLAALRQALEHAGDGSPHTHSPVETQAAPGLGLVLADLVARAHGGRLHLPDTARGFSVALSWPVAHGTEA